MLAGFPPSPIFFIKLSAFMCIIDSSLIRVYALAAFLLLNVLMMCSYIKILIFNSVSMLCSNYEY